LVDRGTVAFRPGAELTERLLERGGFHLVAKRDLLRFYQVVDAEFEVFADRLLPEEWEQVVSFVGEAERTPYEVQGFLMSRFGRRVANVATPLRCAAVLDVCERAALGAGPLREQEG
jgi:hypothetical protein